MAPPSFIREQLHWILEDAKDRPCNPVGVLTTLHRDKWFEARERLMKGINDQPPTLSVSKIGDVLFYFMIKRLVIIIYCSDPTNRASIDDIQNSVMMFCLDEAKPDVSGYQKVCTITTLINSRKIIISLFYIKRIRIRLLECLKVSWQPELSMETELIATLLIDGLIVPLRLLTVIKIKKSCD